MRNRLHRRPRRAVTFLEYCLCLPFFLFMLTLTIDFAAAAMNRAAASSAAYSSATAVATVGGNPLAPGETTRTVADVAFDDQLFGVMGTADILATRDITTYVGFDSTNSAACTRDNPYVTVSVSYTTDMITPGAVDFFNLVAGNGGRFEQTVVGHARCEVIA